MRKDNIYCPLCSKKKAKKFWAMPGYRLARCLNCGIVWDLLPPKNPLAFYDETYFMNENPKGGYANYFEGMRVNRKTFFERIKKIEKKLGGKGKLLDVGCALGDCLLEAKKLGWKQVEGLEVSDYAVKIAKGRGLRVKKEMLERSSLPKKSFDVILYQDVIEHLKDPVGELKSAYGVLKSGGIIFIVTPDIKSWCAKLLGSLWYHYKSKEHLVYFSKETIVLALKKAGFENISSKPTYHILSLEYMLNRLRFYAPNIFGFLLEVFKKTPLKEVPFRAYIGELEAWGQKPS